MTCLVGRDQLYRRGEYDIAGKIGRSGPLLGWRVLVVIQVVKI